MGIHEITDKWRRLNQNMRHRDMNAAEASYNEHAYSLATNLWKLGYFKTEGLSAEVAEARKYFEETKGVMSVNTPADAERPVKIPDMIALFKDMNDYLKGRSSERATERVKDLVEGCYEGLKGMAKAQEKYNRAYEREVGPPDRLR
jgi:hypothetical protein